MQNGLQEGKFIPNFRQNSRKNDHGNLITDNQKTKGKTIDATTLQCHCRFAIIRYQLKNMPVRQGLPADPLGFCS
jgi:hypothetical protein